MFRRQTGLISRVISSSQCPSLDTITCHHIEKLGHIVQRWDPMWSNYRAYTTEKGIRTSSCEQDWEKMYFCPLLLSFARMHRKKKSYWTEQKYTLLHSNKILFFLITNIWFIPYLISSLVFRLDFDILFLFYLYFEILSYFFIYCNHFLSIISKIIFYLL